MQVRGLTLRIEYAPKGSRKVSNREIKLFIEDDARESLSRMAKVKPTKSAFEETAPLVFIRN